MELLMLGTGSAMVTRCFNTCFVLRGEKQDLMVDAGGGNGVLRQAELAELDFCRIHNLFLTHAHTDHILGILWVARAISDFMNQGKYEGDFSIWVHQDCKDLLEPLCYATLGPKQRKNLGSRIHFCLMEPGKAFEAGELTLKPFDICSQKLKQFGFETVLPDGQRLVCMGDEPVHDECREIVRGCDWLLTEAFCCYEDRDRFKPYEKYHSTALDAARIAQELGVKNLLLYHTEDKTLATRRERYGAEARSVFHGNVYIPDDLDVINL